MFVPVNVLCPVSALSTNPTSRNVINDCLKKLTHTSSLLVPKITIIKYLLHSKLKEFILPDKMLEYLGLPKCVVFK